MGGMPIAKIEIDGHRSAFLKGMGTCAESRRVEEVNEEVKEERRSERGEE